MEVMDRPGIHDLLGHARFVRGLARQLVSDDAAADDLAQEAWLATIQRPPQAASRSWFRSVLRNLASKGRRSATRRDRREREAALPETQASALEMVARSDSIRAVAEAVAA